MPSSLYIHVHLLLLLLLLWSISISFPLSMVSNCLMESRSLLQLTMILGWPSLRVFVSVYIRVNYLKVSNGMMKGLISNLDGISVLQNKNWRPTASWLSMIFKISMQWLLRYRRQRRMMSIHWRFVHLSQSRNLWISLILPKKERLRYNRYYLYIRN